MNLQDMIDDYIEQKVEAALSMRLHNVAIKLSKSQEQLDSRVDDLEDKAYTLESELDDAQREVSDFEESLETIKDQMKELQSEQCQTDDKVNYNEANITKLTMQLVTLDTNELAGCNSKLFYEADRRISDLEDGDLGTRISALEEDLLQFNGNVVESKVREAIGNLRVQLKMREV